MTITLLRGRAAEALQDLRLNDRSWLAAAWCQWMDMHARADPQAATWLARIVAVVTDYRWGELWFMRDVLPYVAHNGLPGLLDHAQTVAAASKDDHADGQRAWHFSAYLTGAIDRGAFLAQPAQRQATS